MDSAEGMTAHDLLAQRNDALNAISTLRAESARLREALEKAHAGACRQLAEPRNHDNDQYALTAIATKCEAALSPDDGWLERVKREARAEGLKAGLGNAADKALATAKAIEYRYPTVSIFYAESHSIAEMFLELATELRRMAEEADHA